MSEKAHTPNSSDLLHKKMTLFRRYIVRYEDNQRLAFWLDPAKNCLRPHQVLGYVEAEASNEVENIATQACNEGYGWTPLTSPTDVVWDDSACGSGLAGRLMSDEEQALLKGLSKPQDDPVTNPSHYPKRAGVTCWQIRQTLPTGLSDAVKYIWRCEYKGQYVQDIDKAIEYLTYLRDAGCPQDGVR